MKSVVVGPQTARRLLDIHAPNVQLEDISVVHEEVVLSTGAKLLKFHPQTEDTNSPRFGGDAYLVAGCDCDGADIRELGLEPDPKDCTVTF
jgi:hypothetical protein